jgi:nicotinate-nucleotide adenylyltransferase
VYYKGIVALEFFRRAEGKAQSLGVLPAAFNPPTLAHFALAEAALGSVDQVLFVLPRVFPHKSYEDATSEERIEMVRAAVGSEPRFSIATSEGGLFIEIAEECIEAYGGDSRLFFVCGSDAAERIIHWDYGEPGAFLHMLDRFELLVASRGARFVQPREMRHRIHELEVAEDIAGISATEVRRRIRRGEPWDHLVPASIAPLVAQTYGTPR